MRIHVLSVGKLKDKYLREGALDYISRLKRHCRVEIMEVADEKAPENLSTAEKNMVLKKEGERILGRIEYRTVVVALDICGKKMSSREFADMLKGYMLSGKSDITFVIGGSLGLCDEVLKKADTRLSLSGMTFPHQLARLIILEQIYRAFKIINGEPYHK